LFPGNTQTVEPKQLNKLVQIIDVKDITDSPCVERELMFIKVLATAKTSQIIEIAQIFVLKL
jgi:acetolactate synthase-1/3 small subunit